MGAKWRKYDYTMLLLLHLFQKSGWWISKRSYMLTQETMQDQHFTCCKYRLSWLMHACLFSNLEQWETAVNIILNGKNKSTFKWINLRQFKHKPVWNSSKSLKIFFCLHKRVTLGVYCTNADSTVSHATTSNQQLYKRQIDGLNRQIDGYIDYLKRL